MSKLTIFVLLLAMLVPTAGAQSTDIFKRKKKNDLWLELGTSDTSRAFIFCGWWILEFSLSFPFFLE